MKSGEIQWVKSHQPNPIPLTFLLVALATTYGQLLAIATTNPPKDIYIAMTSPLSTFIVDLPLVDWWFVGIGWSFAIAILLSFTRYSRFSITVSIAWVAMLTFGAIVGSLAYLAIEPSGIQVLSQSILVFSLNILAIPLGFAYDVPHWFYLVLLLWIALPVWQIEDCGCER